MEKHSSAFYSLCMRYSIGTTYEGKNFKYLQEILPYVNHIEVSPDSIAVKRNGRIQINPEALGQLKWVLAETDIDILLHGVGMSIGSYDGYSADYMYLLDELFSELTRIRWHSEHLAYTKVKGENLGTMLALPRTEEVINMICWRIETIQKKYKVPFLLENVISMLPPASCDYSEAGFLNKITSLTGCGLVLDVYNLECDQFNFNLDVDEFLETLNLKTVYEMHLAGGNTDAQFNFKMDIHSQLVESPTLELAKKVLSAPGSEVKAITFEILEEFIDNHGSAAIINQLKRLQLTFNNYEPRVVTNQSFRVN